MIECSLSFCDRPLTDIPVQQGQDKTLSFPVSLDHVTNPKTVCTVQSFSSHLIRSFQAHTLPFSVVDTVEQCLDAWHAMTRRT